MTNYMRIVLSGNDSRLEYSRNGIYDCVPIGRKGHTNSALKLAYRELKYAIKDARDGARNVDKLDAKGNNSILNLLKSKRRSKARIAFDEKKPNTAHKHVAVELEFISSSSQDDIAVSLAMAGVESFVELKTDGSVHGDGSNSGECDGSCREDCECYYCNEPHYCDDQRDCDRRTRNYEGRSENHWIVKDDCDDCDTRTEEEEYTEIVDGIETTLTREIEVSNCQGHCDGHSCNGSDDHPDCDCNCECNDHCGGNGSNDGHEIAIVARSSQIDDVVKKVCAVLAEHDAAVNNTCGMHVHLDMRGHDEKRSFANLVKAQKLLYAMVPVSRFRNSFCKPNTRGLEMDKYGSCRYWGINPQSYSRHKTIEVRLHSGTINPTKILNFVKLLQKIAYSKRVIQVNTLSDFTSRVKIPNSLLQYIQSRIAEFKSSERSIDGCTIQKDFDDSQNIQLDLVA